MTLHLVRHGRPRIVRGRPAHEWELDPELDPAGFDDPDRPAAPGRETASQCRARVVTAVEGIARAHPAGPLVLVGHGTAWTLVTAALTDRPPDLDRWETVSMPDVTVVPR